MDPCSLRRKTMLFLHVAFSISTLNALTAFKDFSLSKAYTTSYGEPLKTFKTRNRHECVSKCAEDESCRSATFDGVNGCATNRWAANSSTICGTDGQCEDAAAVVYAQKHLKTTMRLDCLGHSDCVDPSSICVLNKCQCEPGYHYDGTNYACVTSCTSYGTTFQPDLKKVIFENNRNSETNGTLDSCKALCIAETGFVCRSFDYFLGPYGQSKCKLAIVTALDVPGDYRDADMNDLYTRDCSY